MTKPIGKNQTDARIHNNKAILNLLRKEDMTQGKLAEKMGLSIAAVSMISADLIKYGLIKMSDLHLDTRKGRRPQMLSINGAYGCVVVVSLTDENIGYVIANMKEEIVYSSTVNNPDTIELKALYEVILDIKRVIDNIVKLPLLGIDISTPGKINNITGEIAQSPHFSKEITAQPNFLPDLFHRHFNVPVKITNDINLAAMGEMNAGWLGDDKNANAMYVYVGRGIGSALILNGKPYVGTRGYAGEIGLIKRQFGGETHYLDDIASLNGIVLELEKRGCTVTAETLAERYLSGDRQIVEYVDGTAEELGNALKDLVEVLDLSDIRLAGAAGSFGERYLNIVRASIARSANAVTVDCSTLSRDAGIYGAVSKAIANITAHIIEENEFSSETKAAVSGGTRY